MDAIDRQILASLLEDGRMAQAEIARRVGFAPSAVLARMRRLQEAGVIRGFSVRLDFEALGLPVLAFITMRCSDAPGEVATGQLLAAMDEVIEVHHVAGSACLLVKARCASNKDLAALLRKISAAGTPVATDTIIVFETIKEHAAPASLGEPSGP